ncbi:MAG: hypothetical protein DRJ64_07760 [Thermoprotei archaeon]|nr:MAG: hypothetical protein DRJ64_07760 [Thermoprotei archaeon]
MNEKEYSMITDKELKDGINSIFWKAFSAQLIISKNEQLSLLAGSEETIEIFRCQGRIEVLEDLLLWPEIQLDAIKADEEFNNEKENRNGK